MLTLSTVGIAIGLAFGLANVWLVILGLGIAQVVLAIAALRKSMRVACDRCCRSPPGTHPTIQVCGNAFLCMFNYDTLISSGIAIVLTLAVGLGVSYRLRHGKPGKFQTVLELLLGYIRNLTRQMVSDEGTGFILPIAATIFIFVLFANWLDFFPLAQPVEPAAADINLTLAMAIAVIVIVQWYSIHVLDFRGYLRRFTKPFELPMLARIAFTPFNIIEEIRSR